MQIGIRPAETPQPERDEGERPRAAAPGAPAFDAALARVQARLRRDDDELETDRPEQPSELGAERHIWQDGSLLQLAGLRGEQAPSRATAGNAQLDKHNAQHALSHIQQMQTLVPTQTPTAVMPTVNVVRADLAMPQNMAMHLQQAAAGQWTMRFKADVHTQQLVAPHLHALRDRLKGRPVQLDGFAADDDDLTG